MVNAGTGFILILVLLPAASILATNFLENGHSAAFGTHFRVAYSRFARNMERRPSWEVRVRVRRRGIPSFKTEEGEP
jgi:hypothetical protein